MIFDAVASLFTAGKQNKLAKSIKPIDDPYSESPYTKSLYGQGANLYKGRMAGASAAEQNIATNAANTNAIVGRNAGDASTALAMASGIQGQADQSYGNLAVGEAADKLNRFGVFSDVTQQMTRERDKVHEDKLRKYYDDLNYKRALEAAAMQNKNKIWGALDKTVEAGVSLATMGAFKGGGNPASGGQTPSFGQYPQMQPSFFNPNAGASPAATFGNNIPFNPGQSYQIPGLSNYLNRPR